MGAGEEESPLDRALRRPGFPATRALDPLLTAHGRCLQLPGFACDREDLGLFERLAREVEGCEGAMAMDRTGRHLMAYGDMLQGSTVFAELVGRMTAPFGLTMVDCWVNLYRDGGDMKYWHQDDYSSREPSPCVTMGLSLGEARDLAFHHVETGQEVRVPQGRPR